MEKIHKLIKIEDSKSKTLATSEDLLSLKESMTKLNSLSKRGNKNIAYYVQ